MIKIVSLVSNLGYTAQQIHSLKKMGDFTSYVCDSLSSEKIIEKVKSCNALIVSSSAVKSISHEILSKCPNLKVISVLGVGIDFIDVDSADRLGIRICKLVGTNAQSVAEHAWGLILALSKRINESAVAVKKGAVSFNNLQGVEIFGKSIGILGYGEIGKRISQIAKGFELKQLVYNRSKNDINVNYVDLEYLLKNSDITVISLPLTKDTNRLLDKDMLSLMKNDSILVNIARQAIIDEEALLRFLKNGKFYGFGMDMDINTRPNPDFLKLKNVVITPHNAFYTEESVRKSTQMAVNNLFEFFRS